MAHICLWGTSLKKAADEIQVEAMAKITAARLPGIEITVFSRDAEEIVARHPHVQAVDTRNLPAIARALSRADLLAFVGGPFFEELYQAASVAILVGLAKAFRVPMIAYGTTVFRMDGVLGRPFYRAIFRQMDKICVRERVGREHLEQLGYRGDVEIFADPRFVLAPAPRPQIDALLAAEGIQLDAPRVALTTRHMHRRMPAWVRRTHAYGEDRAASTLEGLARAIDRIGERAQVFCIPMHAEYAEDEATVAAIRSRMRNPEKLRLLSRRYRALEIIGMIAHSDMVLACRFGTAVFATLTATPVLAISHESRVLDHMDRVGLADCVFDWRTLDPEAVAARAVAIWDDREAMRARVGARAAEMEQLAWQNAAVLESYVDVSASRAPRSRAATAPSSA